MKRATSTPAGLNVKKITAYLNGLTGPPTSEEVLKISTIIRLNTYDAYLEARE